ncbi:ribosomal protein L7/L12 [Streptomyces sp. NPDC048641]|uniref:ribosomal protein L7/L12 n=1 Tax=unclassified Streptomyces TaxID=2593676 RepID=UPI00343AA51B
MEFVLLSAVLVLVAQLSLSSPSGKIVSVERRLARLEQKVDLLLSHLGVEGPQIPGMERVHELIRQGKKIEAIKVYRQLTGEGLKESKDAVERMS